MEILSIFEILEQSGKLKTAVRAGIITPFGFNYYQLAKCYLKHKDGAGLASGEAVKITAEEYKTGLRTVYRALEFCQVPVKAPER